jgi:predicted nucleotidyltransferase
MIRDGKKLPDGVQRKVPRLVKFLKNDPDVVALFAFGSLAKNTFKPLSDLDFGILLNSRLRKKQ